MSDEIQGSGESTEVETTQGDPESGEQSPQASSEGSEGTRSKQWVLPGEIESQDELIRNYRNLQGVLNRQGQELGELRKLKETKKVDPEERMTRFAERAKVDPVSAIEDVAREAVRPDLDAAKSEARNIKFQTAYNQYMAVPEFKELEPVMADIANQYRPFLTEEQRFDPKILPILFYAAQGLKQKELADKARKDGERKGEAAAHKKQAAQVERSSGTKGKVSVDIEKMSAEELGEAIRTGKVPI